MSPRRLRPLFIASFLALLPAATHAANSQWHAGSGLYPNASCPWVLGDTATPEAPVLSGGVLTLSTSAGSEDLYYEQTSSSLSIPSTLTISARLRVVSESHLAGNPRRGVAIHFAVAADQANFLWIGQDEVFIWSAYGVQGPTALVDTDNAFHTYDVTVVAPSTVTVRQDGVQILTGSIIGTGGVITAPGIWWGDGTGSSFATSEWVFFRHNANVSDCGTPSLSINDVTVTEGNAGTTNAVFTVSLSSPTDQPVTVSYATANGTATTANNDYVAGSGPLTIPAKATSGTISVAVNGDLADEINETFSLNLSNPQQATIADGQGIGTILNDDDYYRYPPGPAYRNCPDSLLISDIQQVDTLVALCHPVVRDTVLGVAGIVTGFDAKPTSYAVYFQESQGGPWTGVSALTGLFNYNNAPHNLAIGDQIVVYGTVHEFPTTGGVTEIEGPDALLNTNDIVIRKVSSGNALPPFQILTTFDLNWIPGPETPAPRQEQWEECLVRIRGPAHVARTLQNNGLSTNTFLIVNNATPNPDSIMIDGNTLTTFSPPVVGTPVDSVQGIVLQNTTGGVNSYRIALRSAADFFTAAPPSLSDAYPIDDALMGSQTGVAGGARTLTSNLTLRLVFDRAVDVTSAQDESNYQLGSGLYGSTVDLAVVEGGSGAVVLLSVTSVLARGETETVSVSGVGSASCSACMISPSQVRTFITGVLSIADVQAPDPASLGGSCEDRSRFAGSGPSAGTRATVRGIGTFGTGTAQYLEDAGGGPRSGVRVFAPSMALTRGREFLIAGQVRELNGETELVGSVFTQDLGAASEPAPEPFTSHQVRLLRDASCDATQSVENGEDWEGVLVHLTGVRVTENRTTGQSFFVADPQGTVAEDTILVTEVSGYTPPDSGSIVSVTGALRFNNGTFRVFPRGAGDIVETVGVGEDRSCAITFRAFPNPARVVRLGFTLPRRDDVHLAVYDVVGREVAVVARGRFDAGVHSRDWDGRDAAGREAAAGVYWYRLKVGREVVTVRGVKLR